MKNRPYSCIYTAVLVLVGISIALTGSVAAQSTGYVDVAASDLSGSGTADDPYIITNASELQAMEDDLDANYTLGNDINASGTSQWNGNNGFDPIDTFDGSLEGDGNSIVRLTINRPTETNIGIFSKLKSNSTIKDIYIKNSSVDGSSLVGVLTGKSKGTIESVRATGNISARRLAVGGLVGNNQGPLQDIAVSVDINSSSSFGSVGGLFGQNEGLIQNVSAAGRINASGKTVGGLGGYNSGTIRNATATGDVTVSGEYISSGKKVGGLLGQNEGPLRNVVASGNVTGSSEVGGLIGDAFSFSNPLIKNATATGSVTGSSQVGGLIGDNSMEVEIASATGNVTGSNTVGGLVGFHDDRLQNVTAKNNVTATGGSVGGLVGESNGGRIQDAFSTGDVSGSENVGGLVGLSGGFTEDSYWDVNMSGQTASDAGAIGLKTSQMTGETAETNMSGLDFNSVWQTQPNDYPVLRSLTTDGDGDSGDNGDNASGSVFVDVDASDLAGDGTKADPYVITNASELQAMEDDLDAHYVLGSDINASVTAHWNDEKGFDSIEGFFSGSLHGNDHTISELTVNRSSRDRVGLFGRTTPGASIENLSLEGIKITGSDRVGGLVGDNRGTIQNASVNGTVKGGVFVGGVLGGNDAKIQRSSASVSVNGSRQVGGFVGDNEGKIKNTTIEGNVSGESFVGGFAGINDGGGAEIANGSAATEVKGLKVVGGFVGQNLNGTVIYSKSTGNVIGSRRVGGFIGTNTNSMAIVDQSVATGQVNGEGLVGGLVGFNDDMATIERSYTMGDIEAVVDVGGLVGRNEDDAIINQSYTNMNVNGSQRVGGLLGSNGADSGMVTNSYWDKNTTGQSTSAGSAVGLTTTEMTGSAAETNMAEFEFGSIWQTQPDGYPILVQQADDKSDQSGSAQVQLSSVTLTPQSVDSASESTHQLSFEAQNISADGSEDDFDITFPDKVELVSYSDVEIDEKSSDVNKVDNTLEFSVDPTGGGSTQISGELNVTVSATN